MNLQQLDNLSFGLQEENENKGNQSINIIVFIFSFLSFWSNVYVIYKFLKEDSSQRSFSGKIIVTNCFVNIIWTLTQIVILFILWTSDDNLTSSGFLCNIQGLTTSFYFLGTFSCVFVMIYTIYQFQVKNNESFLSQVILRNCSSFSIAIIILLVYSAIPIFTSSYDTQEPYQLNDCFIIYYNNKNPEEQKLRYVAGTIERCLIILIPFPFVVLYYIFATFKIRQKILIGIDHEKHLISKAYIGKEDRKYFSRFLILYPSILIFCWFLQFLGRLLQTLNLLTFEQSDIILSIAYSIISVEGLLNSLVYMYDIRKSRQRAFSNNVDWPNRENGTISILKSSFSVVQGSTYNDSEGSLENAQIQTLNNLNNEI